MASAAWLSQFVLGYPRLAGRMEVQPETAIFRRFGALGSENLLLLQAELTFLEQELRQYQADDARSGRGKKADYALSWYWLSQSSQDGDTKQLDLMLRIREKLKEYNHALIQQHSILSLSEPDNWDLHDLQNFLHTKEMGPLALKGPDAVIWGSKISRKSHSKDLIALRPRPKEDPFSTWIAEKAIGYFPSCGCDRWKKPSQTHGVVGYEDTTIFRITYWFTNLVASLVPVASIVVLYRVRSMSARLFIIGTFNVVVSLCLSAFTKARRSEIFAVTAAFAAVQVVFVATDKNSCGT